MQLFVKCFLPWCVELLRSTINSCLFYQCYFVRFITYGQSLHLILLRCYSVLLLKTSQFKTVCKDDSRCITQLKQQKSKMSYYLAAHRHIVNVLIHADLHWLDVSQRAFTNCVTNCAPLSAAQSSTVHDATLHPDRRHCPSPASAVRHFSRAIRTASLARPDRLELATRQSSRSNMFLWLFLTWTFLFLVNVYTAR